MSSSVARVRHPAEVGFLDDPGALAVKRRARAFLASPLILITYVCLVLYERFVEGDHYAETIK